MFRFRYLAQSFLFTALIAADTGHFFKNDPTLLWLAVQDAVHPVLADDSHRILANTRISKQKMNVFQTARPLVNKEFTFAGAENPPCYDDFRKFDIELMIAIVKIQGYFCRSLGTPFFRTGKNNVLRLLTAQLADILFPHDPADGIGNIALAAAVRSDDSCDSLIKCQCCLICEGLKSPQFHLY